DVAVAQNGIDRHLLARHGVEAETGGDLGDALASLGDHHELRDGDDQEDDEADGGVAADHEVPERGDDVADVGLQQDEPRRGDGDGEAEQRGDEDDGRQRRELDRPRDIEDDQQDEHAAGDVDGNEDVHQPSGQRNDDHDDRDQHHDRHDEIFAAGQEDE